MFLRAMPKVYGSTVSTLLEDGLRTVSVCARCRNPDVLTLKMQETTAGG